MPEQQRKMKRFEHRGDIRFITCSCNHRLPLFSNDEIKNRFVDYLTDAKDRLGFSLFAWVLMPEHFHLLMRPKQSQAGGQVLRGVKAGFAKIVIARWRELDAPILRRIETAPNRYAFWLPGGGYDRNIYTQAELEGKFLYIHSNPVKRGLVNLQTDWIWSSALWYQDRHHYVGPPLDAWA